MQHTGRFRNIAHIALAFITLSATSACSDGSGGTAPGAAWSVDFSTSSLSFTAMNASQSITATVRDNKGVSIPDATVTWASENPSVAEVSGGGRTVQVVAKAPGATNIRVTSGSAQGTLIVTVAGVKAMHVDPANVALRIGETKSVTANVQADAGVSTAVTWTSGNAAVATVNAQGTVTAIGPGSTTIRATSVADTRFHATAQVAVAPLRGIVVAPSTASLTLGQTQAFSATVSLPDGQSTAVTWVSSNTAVATVTAQGVVTAIAVGSANITAKSVGDPTLEAVAQLTVVPSIQSVSVSPATSQLFLGETRTLTATVVGDAGLSQAVTWSSSNAVAATVSSSGVVTALAPGAATITATSVADATKKGTASITVASRPLTVSIPQGNVTVTPGTSTTLTAIVQGDPGVSTAVTWSSGAASIATVSSGGVVTGVADGSAQITATSVADPTKKASVTVTVSGRLVSSWNASRLNGALYEDVVSMYVAADNNVFAVNLFGDVFRYNGTSWSQTLSGSANGTTFTAVHGTSATNVIAVGSHGRIFRWQGSSWSAMTSGTTSSLNAVHAVAADLIYAVGEHGIALRYNGTTWSTLSTGISQPLRGVWGSGNFAAAVGDNGETAIFTGSTWTRISSGTTEHLHAVSGFSSTNVVAVGDFGTMLRFNGMSWEAVQTQVTADLMTVVVNTMQNAAYASGSFGTVLQVSSSAVVPIETPYTTRFIGSAVDASGHLWTAGQRGIVQRYSTSGWTVVNLAPDLIDVWSTSANNAWAVGEFGFVYRWNGTSWARQESPTRERLNAVWGTSNDNAFAGGDGGMMLRWNGTNWSAMSFPSENDVLAIWGSSANNVYAVTFGGEVARFNGTVWSLMQSQANSLYGVFGSGSNDVYAIGDAGTVLRFDGSTWSPRNVNQSALLVGLWASSPTNVLTVGLSPADPTLGAAYRYNGTSWSASSLPMTPPELTSVWGVEATDLYATGGAGTILRFNGSAWQTMPSGTSDYLWAVTGAPGGSAGAFAVGYNSTVVAGSNGSAAIASMFTSGGTPRSFNPSPRSRPATASLVPDGAERKSVRARKRTATAHRN